MVWAVFNLYTFFRIFGLRCTLTSYIPTHHQVLHVHSPTTKQQRFISIPWTPNGYARQNRHPNNLEKTPIGIPCSEEKRNKTIWTSHVENIQIGFTILYYSSQSCKQLIRHIQNEWNHLNVRRSEIWFHAPILHLFDSKIFNQYIQYQEPAAFFPFADWQGSLTLLLQSTWQECHFFHQGSVMLIQRLLIFLLELINALFLHMFFQLLATPLSLHLSGHQV